MINRWVKPKVWSNVLGFKDLIMKLILASEFDISFFKTKKILETSKNKKVVFIPTASYGEGFEPSYDQHIKPFEDMGMEVIQFDLKDKSKEETAVIMKDAGIIYGGPGNTFYFLEYIKSSGFEGILKQELAKGCIYLGSSAGSIVASPDIGFIAPMDDPSRANLNDTKGLGLVDFLFLPHCDHDEMGKAAKEILEKHDLDNLPLYALNDNQAIYVENNIIKVL